MGRRKPKNQKGRKTPPKTPKDEGQDPPNSEEVPKTPERSPEAGALGSGSKSPETSMTFTSPRKSLTPPSFKLFETSRKSSSISKTTTEEQTGSCSESYHHLGHPPTRSLRDRLKQAEIFAANFVKQLRARSKSPQTRGRQAYVFTPKNSGLGDEDMQKTLATIYDQMRSSDLAKKLKEGKACYLKGRLGTEDTKPPSDAEVVCIDCESDEEEDSIGAAQAMAADSGLSASSTSTDPNVPTSASQHFFLSTLSPDSVKRRHASKSPSQRTRPTSLSLPESDHQEEAGPACELRRGAKKTCPSPRKSVDEDSVSSLTSPTRAMLLTDVEVIISEAASLPKEGDRDPKQETSTAASEPRSPPQPSTRPKKMATLAPQPSRYVEDSEQPSCSRWRSTVELNEYRAPSPEPSDSTVSTPSTEMMDTIAEKYEEYLRNVPCYHRTSNELVNTMRDFLAGHLRNEIVREGARYICVGSYSIWMVIQDTCADYWFHSAAGSGKCEEDHSPRPTRKRKDSNRTLLCCSELNTHSVDSEETDGVSDQHLSADNAESLSVSPCKPDDSETGVESANMSSEATTKSPEPRESETSPGRPSRPEESISSPEASSGTQSGSTDPVAQERLLARIGRIIVQRQLEQRLEPRGAYAFFYPPK